MATNYYWNSVLKSRLSRRRAFAGTLAGIVGSSLLAACGGSDDRGGGRKDGSGLLAPVGSTTDKATRGGAAVLQVSANPLNLDVNGSGGNVDVRNAGDLVYRQFIVWNRGTADHAPEPGFTGDTMESWEASPDGMTFTFKLRQQKFDPRPPTNGKQATSQDVKWSMERFEKLHAGRALLFNSVHEDGPISSLQYPDNNTVVMKLAFPTHYLLGSLATWLSPPYLMPLEAEDKFDIKNETRGTGPFMLTAYDPDVRRKYDRNPNFWDAAKHPFVDSVEFITIRENAATLAQFEAGRLWQFTPNNTEALDVKRRSPNINLHSIWSYGSPGASPLTTGNTNYYMFGDRPGSIFKDIRVRQAVSMLQDRDLVLDAVFNIPELEKNGIAMKKAWNGVANAYWGDRMLDPKTNQLGEYSKYWQHNPDEAAKLLRAANAFGSTHTFTTYISGGGGAGDNFTLITNQMLQDGGHFKINYEAIDLATKFLTGYHFGKGQFEGIAFLTYGSYPEFGHYIWNSWMPSGRNAIRNVDISAKASDLARKHRAEFDAKKRTTIEEDWQREIASIMPSVPIGGIGTSFQMTQPWLGNGGQVKTYGQLTHYEPWTYYYYYDKSKDPRAS